MTKIEKAKCCGTCRFWEAKKFLFGFAYVIEYNDFCLNVKSVFHEQDKKICDTCDKHEWSENEII